jgi:hypothetical protein
MTDPHEVRATRNLWVMVVLQAIRDAHGVNTCGEAGARISLEAAQARAWVGTSAFQMVCALAGVDPGRVRRAIFGRKPEALNRLAGRRGNTTKGTRRAA